MVSVSNKTTTLPYKTLSEYGFFTGELNQLIPAARVLFYKPVSSLFSDYSFKSRFVWIPEGKNATIADDEKGTFLFPEGSTLIKHFYYPGQFDNPEGKRKIMETRLLVKKDGNWEAYPYLWNEEQTEALYKITGSTTPVSFIDAQQKLHEIEYVQPNKNQCKSCHNRNEELIPIGPNARNLNSIITYKNGKQQNQLEKWKAWGYLVDDRKEEKYPSMVDYDDIHADLHLRAKAYLEMNCGHCHHPEGPASTSGMFLTYEEENPDKWGVMKPPIAAGVGAGPHTYGIVPGRAEESILVYRMKSEKPGIMMPELGRVSKHQEGVDLIREWIDKM